MKHHDSAANHTQTVDLDGHDDEEVKRRVENETEAKYDRILAIFDKFVSVPT